MDTFLKRIPIGEVKEGDFALVRWVDGTFSVDFIEQVIANDIRIEEIRIDGYRFWPEITRDEISGDIVNVNILSVYRVEIGEEVSNEN